MPSTSIKSYAKLRADMDVHKGLSGSLEHNHEPDYTKLSGNHSILMF